VLDIIEEVLKPIGVERVTNAKCVRASSFSEIACVHVWLRPEGHLANHRLPPGVRCTFSAGRPSPDRGQGRDRHGGNADQVAATDVGGGACVIGDILLQSMVA
jgi:hypothetical protein